MDEKRAKKILAVLREFGVTNEVVIPTTEGPTFRYIPAGMAEWANHNPCRSAIGFGCDIEITCWPKYSYWALNVGEGNHHTIPIWAAHRLWQQEQYVYYLETRTALQRAMIELDKLAPLPRLPGRDVNDVDPYPEDFGQDRMVNALCAEAIENWLRSVPIEAAA
jgi:hypothetical protein